MNGYLWIAWGMSYLLVALVVMAVDVSIMERGRERRRTAQERAILSAMAVRPGELIHLAIGAGGGFPFRVSVDGIVFGFSTWQAVAGYLAAQGIEGARARETDPRNFGGVELTHPSIRPGAAPR